MTREKFVVRLLDAQGNLLAWAEVYAEPQPQRLAASCPFWASAPTLFPIDRSGVATEITVHWCALDVARRNALVDPVPVTAGQVMSFAWLEPVWLVPGTRDVPLPAVTVGRSVVIAPPTGSLTGVGT